MAIVKAAVKSSIFVVGEAVLVDCADAAAEAAVDADTIAECAFAAGFSPPEQSEKAIVALSQASPAGKSIFESFHVSGHSSWRSASIELCADH